MFVLLQDLQGAINDAVRTATCVLCASATRCSSRALLLTTRERAARVSQEKSGLVPPAALTDARSLRQKFLEEENKRTAAEQVELMAAAQSLNQAFAQTMLFAFSNTTGDGQTAHERTLRLQRERIDGEIREERWRTMRAEDKAGPQPLNKGKPLGIFRP